MVTMCLLLGIDQLQHRRERRGLTAAVGPVTTTSPRGQGEVAHGWDSPVPRWWGCSPNGPEHPGHGAALLEDVDAKSRMPGMPMEKSSSCSSSNFAFWSSVRML